MTLFFHQTFPKSFLSIFGFFPSIGLKILQVKTSWFFAWKLPKWKTSSKWLGFSTKPLQHHFLPICACFQSLLQKKSSGQNLMILCTKIAYVQNQLKITWIFHEIFVGHLLTLMFDGAILKTFFFKCLGSLIFVFCVLIYLMPLAMIMNPRTNIINWLKKNSTCF